MGFFDKFKNKDKKNMRDVNKAIKDIALKAFPGGQKQIEDETEGLYIELICALDREETKKLLLRTKSLFFISENTSLERITTSIKNSTEGKLTEAKAIDTYNYIIRSIEGKLYSGGDGASQGGAVIINANDSTTGIPAEYKWVERRYGKKEIDWTLELRFHGSSDSGKSFETFNIKLKDGTDKTIVFDISSFYGKF